MLGAGLINLLFKKIFLIAHDNYCICQLKKYVKANCYHGLVVVSSYFTVVLIKLVFVYICRTLQGCERNLTMLGQSGNLTFLAFLRGWGQTFQHPTLTFLQSSFLIKIHCLELFYPLGEHLTWEYLNSCDTRYILLISESNRLRQ